jgi:hypothetical protein
METAAQRNENSAWSPPAILHAMCDQLCAGLKQRGAHKDYVLHRRRRRRWDVGDASDTCRWKIVQFAVVDCGCGSHRWRSAPRCRLSTCPQPMTPPPRRPLQRPPPAAATGGAHQRQPPPPPPRPAPVRRSSRDQPAEPLPSFLPGHPPVPAPPPRRPLAPSSSRKPT